MFGINDSNTKTNTADADAQAVSSGSLPPNPFSDSVPSVSPSEPETVPPAVPTDSAPVLPSSSSSGPTDAPGEDLLDLKQQALKNLQPLVTHLEQSPEEKFKTTMMLIQATDNASLVKQAYQAANEITDEKARAQALLDIVNEINYFTQKEKK